MLEICTGGTFLISDKLQSILRSVARSTNEEGVRRRIGDSRTVTAGNRRGIDERARLMHTV